MIIEKIKIGGFGKFKNFECSLCKGLQIVYGKNESGKSTIMDFIMLMFYSRLSGEKAGKRDKEIRQKYLPWGGGKMSGTIEFIYDNRRYLLTKEFHADTPNKDKIIFRDLSIGESVSLGQKQEVGEWLFDLDLKGFERSGFIKDVGTDVFNNASNKKDSLSDRIFKIVTGQERENVSEGLVIKKLDDAIKDIEKNKGKLNILENEIYEIKSKIFKINQQVQLQDEYKKQIEILIKRIKYKRDLKRKLEYCILLEKLNNLKEIKLYIENIENIKKSIVSEKITYEEFLLFFKEIKDLKNDIDCKEKVLGEFTGLDDDISVVSDNDFEVFEKAKTRVQKLKDTVFSLSGMGFEKLSDNKKQENDIKNKLQSHYSGTKEITKKKFLSKICLGIGSLAGIGIGLVLKNIFFAFLFGVFFFLICFLVYKSFSSKLSKLNRERIDLESDFNELSYKNKMTEESFKKILLDTDINCNKLDYEYILEAIREKISEQESCINSILIQYDCKNENDFEILYAKSRNKNLSLKRSGEMSYEIEGLKSKFLISLQKIFKEEVDSNNYFLGCEKYSYICSKIKDLENLENIVSTKSVLAGKSEFDIKNIDNTIVSILEEIKKYKYNNDVRIDKDEIEKELKILEEERLEEKYYEIKSKISLIDEDAGGLEILLKNKYSKLSGIKSYLKSLNIAKQVFEESVREIRKDVVPLLDLKASEIFSKLTDSKYDLIRIQKDYTFFVGDNVSYTSLSSGTVDQAYLSLRMAMSEIISRGSHIPFFMDDILMQYDDYRLGITLKFLDEYFSCEEKQFQAVIFTCHDNILEFIKDYNCNIVYL